MPEPFKNLLKKEVIGGMGQHFARVWPEFDRAGFVKTASNNLDALELKERSVQITAALFEYLPDDFKSAAKIMLKSLAPKNDCDVNAEANKRGIVGWAVMPMAHYVGLHGLGHFDLSMNLLKEMTMRSSSEFGIRFFLLEDPARTLSVLKTWADDPNVHVRRLVSEGSRPRLPWAMRLPAFIEDPAPVIQLLEKLKDDEEEYVRRSVANNLNDISKDHPDRVAQISGRWLKGAGKHREKLVRHACRTLIKQGHQGALKAFGYDKPGIKRVKLNMLTPRVSFGTAVEFELSLTSSSPDAQPLVIDYAIHHRKANGSTTAKVFKWKTLTLAAGETIAAKRKHSIRKITTRVYYPGTHGLEIFINGVSVGRTDFELIM